MHSFRLTSFCIVVSAALVASSPRPANAVVIFQEDFTLRAQGTTLFNTSPNVVNTIGTTYKRTDNLASGTEGKISFYGGSPSPGYTGLDWHPSDIGSEQLAGSFAQNFTLPFELPPYVFGTDKLRSLCGLAPMIRTTATVSRFGTTLRLASPIRIET